VTWWKGGKEMGLLSDTGMPTVGRRMKGGRYRILDRGKHSEWSGI
jgi:hypothetical protein